MEKKTSNNKECAVFKVCKCKFLISPRESIVFVNYSKVIVITVYFIYILIISV